MLFIIAANLPLNISLTVLVYCWFFVHNHGMFNQGGLKDIYCQRVSTKLKVDFIIIFLAFYRNGN